MKKTQFYKTSVALLLALSVLFSLVGCGEGNGVSTLSNHTLQTNTSFRISDQGIAIVYVDYTGYDSAEDVEIKIEIQKRTALFFWERVVSQTHKEAGEYFYQNYEYPMNEKGTYRCTVSYTVRGDDGKKDTITFEKTISFAGAVGTETTQTDVPTETTKPTETTAQTTPVVTYPPATVPYFTTTEKPKEQTTTETVTQTTMAQTTEQTTVNIPTTTTQIPWQTETTTQRPIVTPPVAGVDFGGKTFTILCTDDNGLRNTWEEIYSGDRTDEISLALDRRIEEIETLYHCEIEIMMASATAWHVHVDKVANRDRIDLFAESTTNRGMMNIENLAYNLYATGMDLNASYFNQNWIDAFTVHTEDKGNTLYSILGAFSYGELLSANVILYDRALAAEKLPNVNLEALVKNGDWTFDQMAELVQRVAYDADGRGFDTWSNGDVYGLQYEGIYPFFYASGMSLVENKNGHMQLNTANRNGLSYVIDEMIRFFDMKGARQYSHRAFEMDIRNGEQNYRTLFVSGTLEFADTYQLYERFGVLPYPKVAESQPMYATSLRDAILCAYSIPTTVSDIRISAKFLEIFARQSELTVKPVFYEVYGKRYGSAEMIALIEDSIIFDPAYHYWQSNIVSPILDKVNEDKNLVDAYFERYTKRFDELYSALLDSIKESKT